MFNMLSPVLSFLIPVIMLIIPFCILQIQGIKIDVENFEYFALKGGSRILSSNKPVIYAELWDNENRTNCFTLLSDLNYTAHVVEKGILTPFHVDKHRHQNFIFIAN
jgi:hypothetical protein